MTSKEIWNFLVDHHAKFYWSNEDDIQREWESILSDSELFGYSRIRGDVDSHRSLQIGSSERVIPDIILRKNNTDLFVIELKKYSLSFSKEREAQLFSYLKLLHISTGVLVCDKIFVYSYDFDAIEQDNILEIPFEKDNKDGIAFVELFSKESFSKEKIKEYISSKKEQDENITTIKSQINCQFIIDVIKKHFEGEYTVEEVEAALKDFSFSIENKKEAASANDAPHFQASMAPIHTSSGTQSYNYVFWSKFNEYAFKNVEFSIAFSMRKPTDKHWYDLSIGSSKCHIGVTHLKDRLGIEIYIPQNKQLFDHLFSHKDEIEEIIGRQLEWKRLPEKKASRILITTSQFDMNNELLYEKQFDWIIKYTLKFKKAFAPLC